MAGESIIVAIISALGTLWVTRKKVDYELKGRVVESESTTESIYIQNMGLIMAGFKDQVEDLRNDVKKLKGENEELKKEFRLFKQKHHEEIGEYKTVLFELRTERDALLKENGKLKITIAELKGG